MSEEQDRVDAMLGARAREEYHRPPDTPREAMWERIEAERRAAAPRIAPRRLARWWAAGAGVAAALVIAFALGRVSSRVRPALPGVAVAPPASHPAAASPGAEVHTPRSLATAGPVVAATERPAAGAPRQVPSRSDSAEFGAGARLAVAPPASQPSVFRDRPAGSAPMEIAAARHLGEAEALLVSYRAEARQGTVDPDLSAWAGDLLSTTRLLIDSRAARDPEMNRLLRDLELVLAQIAQVDARHAQGELPLIDQAVDRHELLLRLSRRTSPRFSPAGS